MHNSMYIVYRESEMIARLSYVIRFHFILSLFACILRMIVITNLNTNSKQTA